MTYQRVPMPANKLAAQVARYNSFVERGEDADFAKPKPLHKIATPPFSRCACHVGRHECELNFGYW